MVQDSDFFLQISERPIGLSFPPFLLVTPPVIYALPWCLGGS